MNHKRLVDAIISSYHLPYLSKEGYETHHQQWVYFFGVQYPIPIPMLSGVGTQKLAFSMQFDCQSELKWYDVNHKKGLSDASRSSSHHSYTSDEAFETLQQQCISFCM